jgi:glycosyltransferase involved in cell wall biosynthesis
MKVLIDHHEPFALARGGFQIQIEETARGLREIGVETEFLRWWDPTQSGDVLHFFGLPPLHTIERAKGKGMRVVVTHLLTNTCNRSKFQLSVQAAVSRSLLALPPARGFCAKMGWESLRQADAVIVGLEAEARVMRDVWGVKRVHIIPLGLRKEFLNLPNPESRTLPSASPPLISVGTVCPRKGQCELAEAARAAGVPVLFVGNPLNKIDPYWARFRGMCDGETIMHMPHVEATAELVSLYRSARGFVHLSDGENWCFAAHEAAACGLPLMLPDQPWARECFGGGARYWESSGSRPEQLMKFYGDCGALSAPAVEVATWSDVARRLAAIHSGEAT